MNDALLVVRLFRASKHGIRKQKLYFRTDTILRIEDEEEEEGFSSPIPVMRNFSGRAVMLTRLSRTRSSVDLRR